MRTSLTITLTMLVVCWSLASKAQTPEKIYESALWNSSASVAGAVVPQRWFGVRFTTTERYRVTKLAANMGQGTGGTFFIGILRASDTTAGAPAHIDNPEFVTTMVVGNNYNEWGAVTDFALNPGSWAIVVGTGAAGATGASARMQGNQQDIGSPQYIRADLSGSDFVWFDQPEARIRFLVEGILMESACGDSVVDVELGEECDDGGETATCDSDCTTVSCGDGWINFTAGEQCDDENAVAGDGCSSCAVASGWICQGAPSVCYTTCGDGIIAGTEVCDDRNISSGDGCNASCSAVEPGFVCDGAPSVCTTTCGDSIVAGTETCDDANSVLTDGCAGCQQSTGWVCTGAPSVCDTVCGDGIVAGIEACDDRGDSAECDRDCTFAACGDELVNPAASESCDDGNSDDEDGCRNNCVSGTCGDGELQSEVEECDDGLLNSDSSADACRTTCVLPLCGDGVVDSGEECDDDNKSNADVCLDSCELSFCGDGYVNRNEECDDGNGDDTDACPKTCRAAHCGDGFVRDGVEACDDGDGDDNDGCDNQCALPPCGNGIVEPEEGEQCDDGNASNGDGCLNSCRASFCGDGLRQAGEECDDGNSRDDDRCMTSCLRTGGETNGDPSEEGSSGGCSVRRVTQSAGYGRWWMALVIVAVLRARRR